MSTPFLLIEDADVDPNLATAVTNANQDWRLTFHKIADAQTYTSVINALESPSDGDLVAAFDLDYSTPAAAVTSTPYWDAIEQASKDLIPPQTRHGVNALLCLLTNFKKGNCLVVVSSNFTGDGMDSGQALRSEIQKIAAHKRQTAAIHAHFPGGPLTVGNALLADRLTGINNAWNAFFGSMASRLRSSRNSGWFNDSPHSFPVPAHMPHDFPVADGATAQITDELKPWLASLSSADESTIQVCLGTLFSVNGSGFYKHALQHITGACALHCGRSNGKPLNMHGLALLGCCYAHDFSAVFNAITWPADPSAYVTPPALASTASEELLYLLVGRPAGQRNAQPSGVFGILGIHNGEDGGQKGDKTVTSVELTASSVKFTFSVKGVSLANKYNNGATTGNAYLALVALRDTLRGNGVSVTCCGTGSEFTLTITKP